MKQPPALDHVFVFVSKGGGPLRSYVEELGLVETYRRRHPGQGTANICYAFDNAFLELLWMVDVEEARQPHVRRMGLHTRHDGAPNSPFGIAWRGESCVPTWNYHPTYLPEGMSIPVALASDDATQPLCFRSPGRTAPIDWPIERRGRLQPSFSTLHLKLVIHPSLSVGVTSLLDEIDVGHQRGPHALELTFTRRGTNEAVPLRIEPKGS